MNRLIEKQSSLPKVAIVIVNWNKKSDVLTLLDSLRDLNYPDYDIIVVDNASTDGSVEAIRERFPDIELIVNKENLGGTGGFNTGMRCAIQKGTYKYIWLLDNDVRIQTNTLTELVTVMENDEKIGIAGSRIIEPDTDITVECGSYLRKDTIGVIPYLRNAKKIYDYDVVDVDYVAVCSALVRMSILKHVGLMDERFFIFWDDMDWGMSIKKKGFRVVAVPRSIVYHPSFTERDRGLLTNYYYGIRNSLLTYAKHFSNYKLMMILYNFFRHYIKGIIFFYLTDNKTEAHLAISALRDFYKNRWGCFTRWHKLNKDLSNCDNNTINEIDINIKKILVIGLTSARADILKIKELLSNHGKELALLVQDDRIDIYKKDFDNILSYLSNKNQSLRYNLGLYLKLRSFNFDAAISTKFNPFLITAKKRFIYISEKYFFDVTKKINLLTVAICTLIGELLAPILTLMFLVKSIFYRKHSDIKKCYLFIIFLFWKL
jgi:GT2 family glycosyltransferase